MVGEQTLLPMYCTTEYLNCKLSRLVQTLLIAAVVNAGAITSIRVGRSDTEQSVELVMQAVERRSIVSNTNTLVGASCMVVKALC
jgi:hypothetical protein